MVNHKFRLFIAATGAGLVLAATGCHSSVPATHSPTARQDSLLPPITFSPEEMGDFNKFSGLTLSFNKDTTYLYVVNGVVLPEEKKMKFLDQLRGDKIETFQFVPPAVAVPVYGEKAANGAVLVNTR